MQVGGHRHGSGQRETAQPASSNLLIAVLLKYFRSMTLSRFLQAKIQAPAGSLGCGSLLLPAQGNYGGSVVSVLGNKLGVSFNGGASAFQVPPASHSKCDAQVRPCLGSPCQPGFPLSCPWEGAEHGEEGPALPGSCVSGCVVCAGGVESPGSGMWLSLRHCLSALELLGVETEVRLNLSEI